MSRKLWRLACSLPPAFPSGAAGLLSYADGQFVSAWQDTNEATDAPLQARSSRLQSWETLQWANA